MLHAGNTTVRDEIVAAMDRIIAVDVSAPSREGERDETFAVSFVIE